MLARYVFKKILENVTLNELTKQSIGCPYCGETIKVLIDSSDMEQQYIEDCQVCCKPINFLVTSSMDGDLSVRVYSEDEAF
jgi:4-hydroxy-3-methylbut-2-en-1-yl diphosphate synthase IspG/GcpE